MNEYEAKQIAQSLSGEAWQSGGGVWLVILRQGSGKLVAVSDEAVCEYDDEQNFEQSIPTKTILLRQYSLCLIETGILQDLCIYLSNKELWRAVIYGANSRN